MSGSVILCENFNFVLGLTSTQPFTYPSSKITRLYILAGNKVAGAAYEVVDTCMNIIATTLFTVSVRSGVHW